VRHAWRRPQPGEPLHAEHLLRTAIQAIDSAAEDHQPARWHFRLDGADYLAESDGHQWSLTTGAPPEPADVTITATTQSLTALIFAGSDPGIDITGEPGAVQRFRQLISTLATVVHPVLPLAVRVYVAFPDLRVRVASVLLPALTVTVPPGVPAYCGPTVAVIFSGLSLP
jgi:hypothetical protein